jgi:biotin operon repressor
MESSSVMTQHEATILELLQKRPGQVVPLSEITAALYGEKAPASNTIQVFVGRLRKKTAKPIKAVRGQGYLLAVTPSKYYAVQVTRPDAGGDLWAPVRYVDNEPVESGDTPSYDRAAVERRCEELNAGAPT